MTTVTSTPNPEHTNNLARSAAIAATEPDCDYDPNLGNPDLPHPATIMVRLQGTDSLDALSFTCHRHLIEVASGFAEFYDVGDAIEILKFAAAPIPD